MRNWNNSLWESQWILAIIFWLRRYSCAEICDDNPLNLFRPAPYYCFHNSSFFAGWLTLTDNSEACNEQSKYVNKELLWINATKIQTIGNGWTEQYDAIFQLPGNPSGFKILIGEIGEVTTQRCVTITNITRQSNTSAGLLLSIVPPIIDENNPIFWETTVEMSGSTYYQQLRFIPHVPEQCRNDGISACKTASRFVYVDCTSESQTDILHIARSDEPNPSPFAVYKVLEINSSAFRAEFTDEGRKILRLPSNGCSSTYKIVGQSNDKPFIFIAGGLVIVLIIAIAFTAIYMSRVVTKNITIIYCQCEEHRSQARVVNCFEHLLEDYCFVKITKNQLSQDQIQLGSQKDNESLTMKNLDNPDYLIYVPFTHLAEHHSYNAEIEERAHKYMGGSRKIELQMPWYEEYSTFRFWSRGEYKSFVFMQDFYPFINYIHPFYYPRIFERIFRPNLHRASITHMLDQHTFYNAYIEALTDSATFPRHKKTDVLVEPQLELDIEDECFL